MTHIRWQHSLCAALVAIPAALLAASPTIPSAASPAKAVDLFAGLESGDIEATVILSDSTKGTVMVKNKTSQPLTIKMPAALAGVPILAQRGGGGMGGGGMGGSRMGGMQGMGMGMMGGMGMGGMGGMGMGGMGMGGMFSVPPDKVQKIKIAAVCLDHGKTEPNPRVAYKPIPIESYVNDPAVAEVVKLMCAGQLDQPAAQAAAWHLQNGLTWDGLARKIGIKHIDGSIEPYFTQSQLERAIAATRVAQTLAENAAKENSTSESNSDKIAQRP